MTLSSLHWASDDFSVCLPLVQVLTQSQETFHLGLFVSMSPIQCWLLGSQYYCLVTLILLIDTTYEKRLIFIPRVYKNIVRISYAWASLM